MAERRGNPVSDIKESEINLLEILQMLVNRRRLICSITLAAIVLSVWYSLSLKNIYSATAKILPPQKESGGGLSALLGQAGGLAALAAGGLSGGSDLYVSILKSRSVADDVIKKLDLASKLKAKNPDIARRKLSGKINIQAEKGSGIITITARDRDPKQAADIANAFVEELGRTTVRLNLSRVGTERVFLEKRLEIVKSDLKKAEDELKSFAQQNKIVEVNSQAKASIEGIARLKAEIASREVQLSVLRTYQTDESAEVKALLSGIKKLNQEMNKLAGVGTGGEGIPSIGNVPGVGLEYARRMRDMKVQEAVFEQLTKQYEVAKLNEAKDSSTIQVLDSATVPFQKSKPQRSMIVLLATFTAFCCAVFLAFILEFMQKLSEHDRLHIMNMKQQLFTFSMRRTSER